MLRDDTQEINPKIFLFVNPYEVNPGSCGSQKSGNNPTSQSQTLPISVKTDSGDLNSYEYQEAFSRRIKLEMEEFSDLGDLIPTLREKSVMDELDFPIADPEGMTDLTMHSYESPSQDLVTAQDFRKCDTNQQLYIDNQHVNIEDIPEDEFSILQQELSTSCAHSALNDLSNNNNNKIIMDNTSLRDREQSDIFNYGGTKMASSYVIDTDHRYANMSSPSEASVNTQYSPVGYQEALLDSFVSKQSQFRRNMSGLNLGVKLFVGDALNTPDILESVVSLEDDRFNFLRNLDEDQKLKSVTENLSFPPVPSPELDTKNILTKPEPSPNTRWSFTPEEFDDDDEEYIPPKRTRTNKKIKKVIESDPDSDEDYVPNEILKKRTRRISSVSSESSKDSGRVSKYRELRDKNNEASRKSRLKRKMKEQEMESEMQDLESKNVRLKAKVEELKRTVDNFRSNLFKIMAQK